MADKLRIALVGCGSMMGAHVNNGYGKLWEAGFRDFEIVACCDVFEENASGLAEKVSEWQETSPKVYTDFEALLSDSSDYDAAGAVVPHNEHHRVAVPLLEAKKHLLLEKPVALTLRAGRKVLDAADANGLVLSIGENYRRSLHHRTIHWIINSGRIGEPRHIHWLDIKERLWHWGWRDDLDKAGGGWTLDGGVHYADLMIYDLGPMQRVTALSRTYNTTRFKNREEHKEATECTIEDTTMALLEFESGVTGIWSESISAAGDHLGQQIIHGDEGSIDFSHGLMMRGDESHTRFDALKKEFMDQISDDVRERYFPFDLHETLAQEIHEFVNACLHGGTVETDGPEGYKAQAICMAIYESAALGNQPVELSKVEALEIEEYQKPLNESIGVE